MFSTAYIAVQYRKLLGCSVILSPYKKKKKKKKKTTFFYIISFYCFFFFNWQHDSLTEWRMPSSLQQSHRFPDLKKKKKKKKKE